MVRVPLGLVFLRSTEAASVQPQTQQYCVMQIPNMNNMHIITVLIAWKKGKLIL